MEVHLFNPAYQDTVPTPYATQSATLITVSHTPTHQNRRELKLQKGSFVFFNANKEHNIMYQLNTYGQQQQQQLCEVNLKTSANDLFAATVYWYMNKSLT
jgi:hypothetical protein